MSTPRTRVRQPPARVAGTVAVAVQHRAAGSAPVPEVERVETTTHPVVGTPARVRVEGSVTQNMGDYNSVRVSVAVERPCENTDEAIDQTYSELSILVDGYVSNELAIATGHTQT